MMRQATLKGYFVPIQPRIGEVQKQVTAIQQSSQQLISRQEVFTKQSDITNKTPIESTRVASIREQAELFDPNNALIDLFIPPNQPQAAIVKVSSCHLNRLKNITNNLLPVKYPDKFYNECLDDEVVGDFSRVVLWNTQPVGWIRCRLEDNQQEHKQVYVQALGLLAPYRGCGLAKNLIDQVTQAPLIRKYGPTSMYCHVWEANGDALEWYEKRGFQRIILVQHYYRRLKPAGAWIMRKELT